MLENIFFSHVEEIEMPEPKIDPEAEVKKKQPQPDTGEPLRITCGNLDEPNNLLALCDDQKQVVIWKYDESLSTFTLCYQWNLNKKATSVIFSKDGKSVITAG